MRPLHNLQDNAPFSPFFPLFEVLDECILTFKSVLESLHPLKNKINVKHVLFLLLFSK